MRPHAVQRAYYESDSRFNVVPAGRRSGKTEIGKRRLVRRAVRGSTYDRPRYAACAPTRDQAKRIFWEDLKRLVPAAAMRGAPSESELVIPLWHGGELVVVGMDKPERIEGAPIDGVLVDEFANMKAKAWTHHIRPALSDRHGTADMTGVPEGRNHFYERAEDARNGQADWKLYHWKSADILPASEIESARRELDPLTFAQEYEASFVNFVGLAYYAWSDENARAVRMLYDRSAPLLLCFDFNVSPGVAVIAQELRVDGIVRTCVIGEVHIPQHSNTPAVVRKVLADWGTHGGAVQVYGDATGGADGTAKVAGSDWDIIARMLRHGDAAASIRGFGDRVTLDVPLANPPERSRVNAMNTRLCTGDGTRRLLVDPVHAPHVKRDFEGVRTLDGGSGEIDKKITPKLTHLTDALGYYVHRRFPIERVGVTSSTLAA
jgi:hypothetical protein